MKTARSRLLTLTLAAGLLFTGCSVGSTGAVDTTAISPGGNLQLTGNLLVRIDVPNDPQIRRFLLDVLNEDGFQLVPQTVVSALGTSLDVPIAGVPLGSVRVVVRAVSEDEALLGTQEVEGKVGDTLTVVALLPPGQTQEIGLVSVGRNGSTASGVSHSPSISNDGRFVAFASRAALLPGGPPPGVQQIFVRDRVLGTLSRASLRDSGQPFTDDCFEPNIDEDGVHVIFRNGDSSIGQGSVFVRDLQDSETLRLQQGRRPQLSGDGRFATFDFSSGPTFQVVVRRVGNEVVEAISVNAAGNFANGNSTKPCLSRTAQFVVFHSTATDLIPGGTAGVYLRDRINQTIVRLPIPANLDDTVISPDGRFILASAPNQIPFLFDRNTNQGVSLTAIGTGLVGRPSMSNDGNVIAFYSSNANLINQDVNNLPDVFALDRNSGTIARVNVSSDGTAVRGGIDETNAGTGPSISGLGGRIAFAAPDRDLVPNGNSQLDVYSSNVPRRTTLYALQGTSIQRFNNINQANGPIVADATISGGSTRLFEPRTMFLDKGNNRLYVFVDGNADVNRDPELLVFNQIALRSGNVAPSRIIKGISSSGIFTIDLARNILYYVDGEEIVAVANASQLNGTISAGAKRRFRLAQQVGSATQLLLDSRLDELYIAANDPNSVGKFVSVVKASSASGTAALRRRMFGATAQIPALGVARMLFDTSPKSFVGGLANDANLVLMGSKTETNTYPGNGSRNGFLGGLAPISVVPGSNSVIIVNPGTPKEFSIGPSSGLDFDPTSNLRFVGNKVDHTIGVFRSTPGVVTPDRTLVLPNLPAFDAFPQDFAIDRL